MKFLSSGVLFFLIFNLTGCDQNPSQLKGTKAPDVFLKPLLQDQPKNPLSELYSEAPVLLVFWASWCPSCVEEMPLLNEWHKKFSGQGLTILGVNVQESPGEILEFRKKQSIDYPIVLDEEGEIAEAFGLVGLPSSVFLAKGGEILYYGFSLPHNIDQLLKKGETKI